VQSSAGSFLCRVESDLQIELISASMLVHTHARTHTRTTHHAALSAGRLPVRAGLFTSSFSKIVSFYEVFGLRECCLKCRVTCNSRKKSRFAAMLVGHKQSNLPIDHKILNKKSVNNKDMKRTEKG
jgi:hypothetical protein